MPSVLSKLVPFAVAGGLLLTQAVIAKRRQRKTLADATDSELSQGDSPARLLSAATIIQSWARTVAAKHTVAKLRRQVRLRQSLAAAAVQAAWRQRVVATAMPASDNGTRPAASSAQESTLTSPPGNSNATVLRDIGSSSVQANGKVLAATGHLASPASVGSNEQSRMKAKSVRSASHAPTADATEEDATAAELRSPISPRRLSLSSPPHDGAAGGATATSATTAAVATAIPATTASEGEAAPGEEEAKANEAAHAAAIDTATSPPPVARPRFGAIPKLGISGPARRVTAKSNDETEATIPTLCDWDRAPKPAASPAPSPVADGKKRVRIQEPAGVAAPTKASASLGLPVLHVRRAPLASSQHGSMGASKAPPPPPSAVFFKPQSSLPSFEDVVTMFSAAAAIGAHSAQYAASRARGAVAATVTSSLSLQRLLEVFICALLFLTLTAFSVQGAASMAIATQASTSSPVHSASAPVSSSSVAAAPAVTRLFNGSAAYAPSARPDTSKALVTITTAPSIEPSATTVPTAATIATTTSATSSLRPVVYNDVPPAAKQVDEPPYITFKKLRGRIKRIATFDATSMAFAVVPGIAEISFSAAAHPMGVNDGLSGTAAAKGIRPPRRLERSLRAEFHRLRLRLKPLVPHIQSALPPLLVPLMASMAVAAVAQSGATGSVVMLAGIASFSAGVWPRAFVWTHPMASGAA